MKRSINWKKLLLYVPIAGLLVFIYFSFLMLITPDSVGYYSYLNILNGTASFSVWNTTRGPGMPFILFLITKLFGATELGLLIGSFIFFVLALFIAFKLVQIIQKDFKERKVNNYIVWILFVVLIMFNPLIIGYYHVLLTEFVAATAAIVSCYLSFKWISIEFIKSKFQFIIYTIVFCLLSVLMWFVKQPYVTVVVLPLFIATVLSMIKIGNIKNIASKAITLALVIVCIVGGIGVWNEILKKNNVTFSKSLNSYALHGVIAALTDFPKVPYEESHSASYLSNTEYLTSEEVNETESILNGNSKYQDYNIYEVKSIRHNVVIDRIVVPLVYKDDLTSTDVLTFFKECVKKHPLQVLDSYLVNYFTESDIYPFQMDNEGYIVPVKILIPVYQFWNENLSIGLGTYYKGSTFLEGTPKIDTMEQYEMPMSPDSSLNYGMKVFSKLIIITYKITFVLVPVFSVFFFIKYCIAIVKKKDSKYLRLYELLVILFGFAFLHLLSNVFTGLIIDRYAFVAYLPALLGMILLINFLDFGEVKVRFIEIVNKLKKKEK